MAKSASTVKKDRFKSVASRRVQKVLDDLDSLAKCANKSTYEYTEADVKKMKTAINSQVQQLWGAFSASDNSRRQTFTF